MSSPTLPLSAAQPAEYTPPDWADRDPLPVFRFRVPTLETGPRFRHELKRRQIALPSNADLRAALLEAVPETFLPEDVAQVADVLQRYWGAFDRAEPQRLVDEAPLPADQALLDELGPQVVEIAEEASARHEPYRELVSAMERDTELFLQAAAQFFCVGWSHATDPAGRPVAFRRAANGGADPTALAQLGEPRVLELGGFAAALRSVSAGQKKS